MLFQCCCNVATCPCLLLQSWIATRPDEQRDTLTKLFMSYVGEENPVEPGIMFDFIGRNCKEAMKTPKAGRASSCLVLLQSLLDDDDVELSASFGPDAQNDLNGEIERIFLYCICWSIGGLLEADDRTKFDAFLRWVTLSSLTGVFSSMYGPMYIETDWLIWIIWTVWVYFWYF